MFSHNVGDIVVPSALFADIHYFLALPDGEERDAVHHILDAGGATMEFFYTPTLTNLIIAENIEFPEYPQAISQSIGNVSLHIIYPEWIWHCLSIGSLIPMEKYLVSVTSTVFQSLSFCIDDNLHPTTQSEIKQQLQNLSSTIVSPTDVTSTTNPISYFISSCPNDSFYQLTQSQFITVRGIRIVHPEWIITHQQVPWIDYQVLPITIERTNVVSEKYKVKSYLKQFKEACQISMEKAIFQNDQFAFVLNNDESQQDLNQINILSKKIIECGGQIVHINDPSCTHFILSYQSPLPLITNQTLVTSHYIRDCLLAGKRLNDKLLLSCPMPHQPIARANQLKIAVSGYAGKARADLYDMITLMGAELSLKFTPQCSILISAHRSGEKYKYALFNRIPILNHRWIEDCLLEWTLLPYWNKTDSQSSISQQQPQSLAKLEKCQMDCLLDKYTMFCPNVLHKEIGNRHLPNNTMILPPSSLIQVDHVLKDRKRENQSFDEGPIVKRPNTTTNPTSNTTNNDIQRKPVILFTNVEESNAYHEIIKGLNGRLANSVKECTHVVTTLPLVRTAKLLAGICVAEYIVTIDWLEASRKVGQFIDETQYLPKDRLFDETYHFDWLKTMERRLILNGGRLFDGYTIYVTPNVHPDINVLRSLIQCSGATFILQRSLLNGGGGVNTRNCIVLSCEKDLGLVMGLKKGKVPCYLPEFLLSSLLHQKIQWDYPTL